MKMRVIEISTQAELDALPVKFDEYTRIIIKNTTAKIYVNMARGNSSVEAWENSSVVARGNSSVEARGNSSVVARENSSVVARGNSSVEAWDFAVITIFYCLSVVLRKFATGILREKESRKKVKKAKTAILVDRTMALNYDKKEFFELCEKHETKVVLYKRVTEKLYDFRSETIKYEGVVACPDFDGDPKRECGGGLHLCRTISDLKIWQPSGRILKCLVDKKDIVVYGKNITKVRCRKVEVLHEVNLKGEKI